MRYSVTLSKADVEALNIRHVLKTFVNARNIAAVEHIENALVLG